MTQGVRKRITDNPKSPKGGGHDADEKTLPAWTTGKPLSRSPLMRTPKLKILKKYRPLVAIVGKSARKNRKVVPHPCSTLYPDLLRSIGMHREKRSM